MRKLSKERSLVFLNPELSKEWDYEKNYPLTPEDVFAHSGKKVGWICKKGHKYNASIYHRSRGRGCPYCVGKKVHMDNCLATINPELAKEWNYNKNGKLTSRDVTANTHKKAWWKCKKGHEWKAQISSRNSGNGCPCCSGHKVCNDNCLATINPELAKEWNYNKNGKLTPRDVLAGGQRKVWWQCGKGHEWEAIINSRIKGSGCPYCSGHKVCNDNCLATINPKLAKEWHSTKNGKLTPHDVTANINKKVWWLCKAGHEWKASVEHRNYGSGCPYCYGRSLCLDNCLASKKPELAKEWHPTKNGSLSPYNVFITTRKKVWWKCKNNHEWKASIEYRSYGSGCPYCHKIELKNGTICDSLVEAYYYLELRNKNVKFKNHVSIGLGRCTCDFYIPSTNKYIEVTGYTKQWKYWGIYYKNILRKKKHVTKKLKAKFEFVKVSLTSKQTQYVRANAI